MTALHRITADAVGPLPASLLVPGHVTFDGVVIAVVGFVDEEDVARVRVEYVDGDHAEYEADDDIVVLAVVEQRLLWIAQDSAR